MQWGDVGEWVGSIGASVSVFLALYIMLSDRRSKRRDQARSIFFWEVMSSRTGSSFVVRNGSTGPITIPTIYIRTLTKLEHIWRRKWKPWRWFKDNKPHRYGYHLWNEEQFESENMFVDAGEEVRFPNNAIKHPAVDPSSLHAFAVFQDGRNEYWTVNLDNNKLHHGDWWFKRELRLEQLMLSTHMAWVKGVTRKQLRNGDYPGSGKRQEEARQAELDEKRE